MSKPQYDQILDQAHTALRPLADAKKLAMIYTPCASLSIEAGCGDTDVFWLLSYDEQHPLNIKRRLISGKTAVTVPVSTAQEAIQHGTDFINKPCI